jgi:hypothetical protein
MADNSGNAIADTLYVSLQNIEMVLVNQTAAIVQVTQALNRIGRVLEAITRSERE